MLTDVLPIRLLRQARYRRRFVANTTEHLFMGTYGSFAEAEAAAPKVKPLGFDNAQAARAMFSQQVLFYDYPALFWIGRSFDTGLRTVFDLGGHAGIKFHAWRRLLTLPAGLHWRVCDVPGVIQAGREIAAERGIGEALSFTSEFREASGFDVLFVAGCLQFLPESLSEILAALPSKPKRIILNTTTVHPERTIHTVHSLGFAFCAYRIVQADRLLQQLTDAGYTRRDLWRNEGKPITVPFVRGGDQAYYMGGCFDLRQPA